MGDTKFTVLVVDDNPDSLQIVEYTLSSRGYNVRTAPNGKLALQSVNKSPPDLILLDIHMPGMDGYEVCKRLKSDPNLEGIPIIFVSALGETFNKLKAFECGGVAYLTKPVEPEELLAYVKANIQLAQYRRMLEDRTETAEERFFALRKTLPDILFLVDEDGKYIDVFTGDTNLLFQEAESVKGRYVHDIFPKEEADGFMDVIKKTLEDDKMQIIEYAIDVPAGKRYFEGRSVPVNQKIEGKAVVVFVARDITRRKEMEGDLKLSEEKFRSISENIPEIVYRVEVEAPWKIEYINENVEHVTGFPAEDFLERSKGFAEMIHEEDLPYVIKEVEVAVKNHRSFELEYRIIRADGEIIWVYERGNPIYDNKDPIYIDGVLNDITARKEMEKAIQASLEEKSVLLREVHHRVKNNMQIIISLLNLHYDGKEDAFSKELKNRIMSMSMVHESLYRSKNLSEIPFKEYILQLSANLSVTYCGAHVGPKVKTDMEAISIGLDESIPLGLLLNEVITNSFKHASVCNEGGMIDIKMQEKDGELIIVVADDGAGMDPNIDIENTETLGLRLTRMLCKQLEAELKFEQDNGTKVTIAMPMKNRYPNRI